MPTMSFEKTPDPGTYFFNEKYQSDISYLDILSIADQGHRETSKNILPQRTVAQCASNVLSVG